VERECVAWEERGRMVVCGGGRGDESGGEVEKNDNNINILQALKMSMWTLITFFRLPFL